MSTRTTNDGVTAGQTGRFTNNVPDALNVRAVGSPVAGRPPSLWMTGGGIRANASPAATGFDRILDVGCDDYLNSIGQPDTPWFLGNDGVQARVDNAVTWLRNPVNGINASTDPPLLMGYSNGAICALRYARDNPVTGIALCLPPVDNDLVYTTNYGSGREVFEHGAGVGTGGGWGPYIPALDPYTAGDHLPDRGQPWGNEDEYQHLRKKVIVFYSASDYIFSPQQMSFYTQIGAEMHNIGPIGHVGTWSTTWLGDSAPADLIDADRLFTFWDECIARL